MSRLSRSGSAVLGLFVSVSLVLGGCNSAALPELTDPTAIITAALKATEGAKSVHLDLTVEGSINADLFGTGDAGAAVTLTGTSLAADVDMTGGNMHATFAIPALLGLTGELIQIGTTSYVKTSLGGPLFEVTEDSTGELPIDPANPTAIVDGLGDFLLNDAVNPVKGEDVECGSAKCYAVTIELTPEVLAALDPTGAAAEELPIDLSTGTATITVRVDKNTYRLAGISIVAAAGDQGSLTLEFTLSKWDEALTIAAPPADQLAPAS
jgi:hypothetical protein